MSADDGIIEVPRAGKRGVILAFVSGRGITPVDMIPSICLQSWPTNTNFAILPIYGKDTDAGRNMAVKQALADKAKYLWFVDDDTVPPQDAGRHLIYLLEQNGPKAMVSAGVYCTRSVPPEPIIYTHQGAGPDWNWRVGDVFKRWGAGTGCMMINTDVFENIPEPWFKTTQEAHSRETDDLYFCEKVAKAGFDLWIHGGILCHHHDMERGAVYMLPRNSKPYLERSGNFREPGLSVAAPSASAPASQTKAKIGRALEIDGWMTEDELCWLAEHGAERERIAEIGSFMGRSTAALAENTKGTVCAIDTWNGSEEHAGILEGKPEGWLKRKFLSNTANYPNVASYHMDSVTAASTISDKFDMVFIDGDHSYEGVMKDIQAWMPMVRPGGLLCGHDYQAKSVAKAVDELVPSRKLVDRPGNSIWYMEINA